MLDGLQQRKATDGQLLCVREDFGAVARVGFVPGEVTMAAQGRPADNDRMARNVSKSGQNPPGGAFIGRIRGTVRAGLLHDANMNELVQFGACRYLIWIEF